MRIGIVGAGLLGAGVALELAERGHDVEVFEREGASVSRASCQNEGKVHLGFVYGHDPSLATARLMARGAYCFAPIVRRWLALDRLPLVASSPFHYFVHRDSLCSTGELQAFYGRVVELAREESARPGASYLDVDTVPCCRRLTACERARVAGDGIVDAFLTSELAVDPEPLAELVRARLAGEPRVALHLRTTATAVTIGRDEVEIDVAGPEGARRASFDHVVNASWDDLLRLDRSAGVEPRGPWSFRLKRYLRARVPDVPAPPSATIVLGAFGDVVRYASGHVFLSWYPAGCTGLSTAIRHPEAGRLPGPEEQAGLRRAIHRELAALVPALEGLPAGAIENAEVLSGIILAQGVTDVNDHHSGLHARFDVGPRSFGRYHSVDTGKWTVAPLFARSVANRIVGDA
ncbi:MAG: FAD-dependent oxidoreductase [Vicinamibacterales bacterium]